MDKTGPSLVALHAHKHLQSFDSQGNLEERLKPHCVIQQTAKSVEETTLLMNHAKYSYTEPNVWSVVITKSFSVT